MPRFFFHVRDDQHGLDEEGTVLTGLPEARAEAIQTGSEMIRDIGGDIWDGDTWTMDVVDESGATVFKLTCAMRCNGAEIAVGSPPLQPRPLKAIEARGPSASLEDNERPRPIAKKALRN